MRCNAVSRDCLLVMYRARLTGKTCFVCVRFRVSCVVVGWYDEVVFCYIHSRMCALAGSFGSRGSPANHSHKSVLRRPLHRRRSDLRLQELEVTTATDQHAERILPTKGVKLNVWLLYKPIEVLHAPHSACIMILSAGQVNINGVMMAPLSP